MHFLNGTASASLSRCTRRSSLLHLKLPCLLASAVLALAHAAPAPNARPSVADDEEVDSPGSPYVLPLHREAIPVMRGGKVAAHKSAYFGTVSIGWPQPQEFSVLFDTGSGHVVVPSLDCESEPCLKRRRYNMSASSGAVAVNSDSEPVPPDEYGDQVTIGFGTGSITGELIRERVCVGPPAQTAPVGAASGPDVPCTVVTAVMAVEMSTQPFNSFAFDGLFGLGLGGLALGQDFSFFAQLAKQSSKPRLPRFGIYLSQSGEAGDQSEIAIGGHNPARVLGPLRWAPIAKPQLGYWQVQVHAVRVDGVELAACRGGKRCRAVLDTGTSHIGVPTQHFTDVSRLLSAPAPDPAGGAANCLGVAAPVLSIDLGTFTIELQPKDYMRPAPLTSDAKGNPLPLAKGIPSLPPAPQQQTEGQQQLCKPRLMPVALKAPLGPDLFILGEPVLQRYYTVYDWRETRVGFAKARAGPQLASASSEGPDDDGLEDLEEYPPTVLLLQVTLTIKHTTFDPCAHY